MANSIFDELRPDVVLAVAAHPDDIDFSASGTVARFTKQGAEVYYLVLTDGGSGSKDREMTSSQLRDIRRQEQRAASRELGIKDVFFFDYVDGALVNSPEVRRDIVRVIRRTKPQVVITLDPATLYVAERGMINHPDHRAAGQATLDAVFPLARDHMSFPELYNDEGLEPHTVATALLVSFDGRANYHVNIRDTLADKLRAIAAHDSQFDDLGQLTAKITEWAHLNGEPHGMEAAESFIRIDIG